MPISPGLLVRTRALIVEVPYPGCLQHASPHPVRPSSTISERDDEGDGHGIAWHRILLMDYSRIVALPRVAGTGTGPRQRTSQRADQAGRSACARCKAAVVGFACTSRTRAQFEKRRVKHKLQLAD